MKARPDTPISLYYSIAIVVLTRSGAPGGIRTPGLLVRRTNFNNRGECFQKDGVGMFVGNHRCWAELGRICAAKCAAHFCRCVELLVDLLVEHLYSPQFGVAFTLVF